MENRYFTASELAVLLDPARWRLAEHPVTEENPRPIARHRSWRLRHRHAHPHAEALIALAGNTVYGQADRIYPCRPGTVMVFESNCAHDLGYPPWTPAIRHLWLSFIQDKAMARLVTYRAKRIRSSGSLGCLLDLEDAAVWQPGAAATANPALPSELIRLRRLAALMSTVAALVQEGYRQPENDRREAVQKNKIAAICRQIRETGGAGASLAHLAEIAGYSKFHFLRLFRRHTGQTIHAFVNQARRSKIQILRARGLPLKAIAAELGFSCPAAFSRWYRPFRT